MSEDGPVAIWRTYLSLKLHFKGNMDYFKYGGKTESLTLDAFLKRKDRGFFERIHKRYKEDYKRFLLSCFVSLKRNPGDLYVHEMLDDEHYEESWKRFLRVESSLSNTFKTDLLNLLRKTKDGCVKTSIRPTEEMPVLLKMVFVGSFNIESYVILNKIVPFNELYRNEYPYDPRVQILCNVCKYYDPFLNVDLQQVQTILKDLSEQERKI